MSLGSAGGCFTVCMISVDFGSESTGRFSSALPSPSLGAKSSAELEAAASESGVCPPHPSLVMSQPSPSPLPLQPHFFCGRYARPSPRATNQLAAEARTQRAANQRIGRGPGRAGPGARSSSRGATVTAPGAASKQHQFQARGPSPMPMPMRGRRQ